MKEVSSTTISTAGLEAATHSSLISVVQQALAGLGWEDLRPVIYAAEQVDRITAAVLLAAYEAYIKEPEESQQQRLQTALDEAIDRLQADYQHVLTLKAQAEKRLSASHSTPHSFSYTHRLRGWTFKHVQQFFSSDDNSLVIRYRKIAKNRQQTITILNRYRNQLAEAVRQTKLANEVEQNSSSIMVDQPTDARQLDAQSDSSVIVINRNRRQTPAEFLSISVHPHARRLLTVDSGEFEVNSRTSSSDYGSGSGVGAFKDGGFIISRTGRGEDGVWGIYAQRYNAAGAPLGSEFRVNTYTDDGENPSIGTFSNGGFVIAWRSFGGVGYGSDIYAQRYNAAGFELGRGFRVNTYTEGNQDYPRVGTFSDGGFLVAWQSFGRGVYAQRYTVAGFELGREFRVSQYSSTIGISVGTFSDGGFVITWAGRDENGDGVFAQRYNAAGFELSREFQVNTYTDDHQYFPNVGTFTDGGFAITWVSRRQDGSRWGIYAQRYTAAGAALGSEFRVTTDTEHHKTPCIGTFSDGGFVIAWVSEERYAKGTYKASDGIYAKRYTAAGAALGSEFRVTTYADERQTPSVTTFNDGGFVIAWGSKSRMKARLFSNPDTLVSKLIKSLPSVSAVTIGTILATITAIIGGSWRRHVNRRNPPAVSEVKEVLQPPTGEHKPHSQLETQPTIPQEETMPMSYISIPSDSKMSKGQKVFEKPPQLLLAELQEERERSIALLQAEYGIPESPTHSSSSKPLSSFIVPLNFTIRSDELEVDEKTKLGEGAYGNVYRGRLRTHTEVAVKVFHAKKLSEEACKEIKKEATKMAEIMARDGSDYLVQLRGVCLEPPRLVMELMETSLYMLLTSKNQFLSLKNIYQIALDIGYGLCVLHEVNIIHRDLKSPNILIRNGRAKIGDFGFAKVKSASSSINTEGSAGGGTLVWMAPERFESKPPPLTPKVDIYAYGLILWELIVKPYRTPFKGRDYNELMLAKIFDHQETIPQDCPPDYERIILDCWNRVPDKRPTARQLVGSLESLFKAKSTKKDSEGVNSLIL